MKTPIRKKVAEANGVSTEKPIYSVVIDGCNLLKICMVNKHMNDLGKDYGAVHMFLIQIGRLLMKKDFDYCTVCWDGEGSGFLRWKLYPDYKANRDKNYALHDPDLSPMFKEQLLRERIILEKAKQKLSEEDEDMSFHRQKLIVQRILDELCVRQFEYELVEGDDLISNYVRNKKESERVVIMSGDKDITQLISPTVAIYHPNKHEFITESNAVSMIGVRHDNVVVEKILCGDSSDNIKGIKGIGEQTLLKHVPELLTEKVDLGFVLKRAQDIQDERKSRKLKPLKALDNILQGITDGSQGDNIYEVNKAIIDLSEPLLTDEAKQGMEDECYAPIDTSERDVKNVYRIINDEHMYNMTDESKFGNVLAPFGRIIAQEQKRYKMANN